MRARLRLGRRGLYDVAAALTLFVGLSGCAALGYATQTDPPPTGTVHRFQQGSLGGRANVYWVDTAAGPVVVDVPLSISETKKLRAAIVQPYRIYITASRPQRFGGLATLQQGDVPACTTAAVATEIKIHGDERLAPLYRQHPSDVAAHVAPPSPCVEERTHDLLGEELEIELVPLGAGEAGSSLALFLPKTGELIAGDTVAGHEHVDLSLGPSATWRKRIAELKTLEPRLVYPGHGLPGGPELLDDTLAYLNYLHSVVTEYVRTAKTAEPNGQIVEVIKQQMIAKYPTYGRPELLPPSIRAEYAAEWASVTGNNRPAQAKKAHP